MKASPRNSGTAISHDPHPTNKSSSKDHQLIPASQGHGIHIAEKNVKLVTPMETKPRQFHESFDRPVQVKASTASSLGSGTSPVKGQTKSATPGQTSPAVLSPTAVSISTSPGKHDAEQALLDSSTDLIRNAYASSWTAVGSALTMLTGDTSTTRSTSATTLADDAPGTSLDKFARQYEDSAKVRPPRKTDRFPQALYSKRQSKGRTVAVRVYTGTNPSKRKDSVALVDISPTSRQLIDAMSTKPTRPGSGRYTSAERSGSVQSNQSDTLPGQRVKRSRQPSTAVSLASLTVQQPASEDYSSEGRVLNLSASRLTFLLHNRGFINSDENTTSGGRRKRRRKGGCITFTIVTSILIVVASAGFIAHHVYNHVTLSGDESIKEDENCYRAKDSVPPDWHPPFSVSIAVHSYTDNRFSHRCAGVVLDKRLVLTTASCVLGNRSRYFYEDYIDVNVRVCVDPRQGKTTVTADPVPGFDQTVTSSTGYIHSSFASLKRESVDLALLKTEQLIRFTKKVYPPCLADDPDPEPPSDCILHANNTNTPYQVFNGTECCQHLLYDDTATCSSQSDVECDYAMNPYVCTNNTALVRFSDRGSPLLCIMKTYTDKEGIIHKGYTLVGLLQDSVNGCTTNSTGAGVASYVSYWSNHNWIEYVARPALVAEENERELLMVQHLKCLHFLAGVSAQYLGNETEDKQPWPSIVSADNQTENAAEERRVGSMTAVIRLRSNARLDDSASQSLANSNKTYPAYHHFLCRTFVQWVTCNSSTTHVHQVQGLCYKKVVPKYLQDNISVLKLFEYMKCKATDCVNGCRALLIDSRSVWKLLLAVVVAWWRQGR